MVAVRWIVLVVALCSLPALGAQAFDADEFFGKGAFVPKAKDPREGTLSLPLAGEAPASFVDLSRSGEGRVADCFKPAQAGLIVSPAERESAAAELDAGFTAAMLALTIVELDRGGTLAVHLRGRGDGGRYLAEVVHGAGGGAQLRLRVFNATRGRWTEIPGAGAAIATFTTPAELKLGFSADALEFSVGAATITAKAALADGATCGVAVSDQRARIKGLTLAGTLHADWMREAAVRLHARKTLARLREYATYGLLKGIAATPHPDLEPALAKYTAEERKAREAALTEGNFRARRDVLLKLAQAHPDLAPSRHEAGVAALLAGDAKTGESELEAAVRLKGAPVSYLALAEAYSRFYKRTHAAEALGKAIFNVPKHLGPDAAMIHAHWEATNKGSFMTAHMALSAAAKNHPEHEVLAAFADSAAELAHTSLPKRVDRGPLGFFVQSDLPQAQLEALLARLKPHLQRFKLWLPNLPDSLKGCIRIYANAEEYLRAALILANDNLDNVAGMFMNATGQPLIMACRAFGEDELLRTLVHELWHAAYSCVEVKGDLPAWLNEGMAVHLSAGIADSNGVVGYTSLPSEFEGMKDELLKALADETTALAMLAAGREKFYLPENLRMNYAIAWAVTRHLALDGLESAATLGKLLDKRLDDQVWLKEAGQLLAAVRKSVQSLK